MFCGMWWALHKVDPPRGRRVWFKRHCDGRTAVPDSPHFRRWPPHGRAEVCTTVCRRHPSPHHNSQGRSAPAEGRRNGVCGPTRGPGAPGPPRRGAMYCHRTCVPAGAMNADAGGIRAVVARPPGITGQPLGTGQPAGQPLSTRRVRRPSLHLLLMRVHAWMPQPRPMARAPGSRPPPRRPRATPHCWSDAPLREVRGQPW